ncbi:MAG TPA: tRNA lysidine(34) synthetase TilS [Nevskiales bacterium]|nr:tRNA lysidine(34) synthetase TilS [Nevskiales bacterium]
MAELDRRELLGRLPRPGSGGRYLLAFSGGLDSTVLLHLLMRTRLRAPLAAVHVHHGLQVSADDWVRHCRQICREWAVPLIVRRVAPRRGPRRSLEAEARALRYAALRGLMRPGDVLLTAHQIEDQAETLLLQLLRGAGPRGLAAMPAVSEFPPGLHVRPLLTYGRAELEAYARTHRLHWVEDPSNQDRAHARNFLRHDILPRLRTRWPQADRLLSRSAALCAEAAELLDAQAEDDLEWCAGEQAGSLSIPALLRLTPARRRNLLRAWLGWLELPLPEARHLQRLDREVLQAPACASPRLAWPGAELRRYRERLFAMRPLAEPPAGWQVRWRPGDSAVALPDGSRLVARASRAPGALRPPRRGETVSLRLAHAGERLRLPGRAGHSALKTLCQAAGIPPWLRPRLPVLLYDGRIAAIADRWIAAEFAAAPGERGWRLHWRNPPPGYPAS